MKSKKVLSILLVFTFLLTSVFGCFNVFALETAEETNVKVPSGNSAVKTVIVDDDFEDRTVGATSAVSNNKGTIAGTTENALICEETEGGNKYITNTNSKWVNYTTVPKTDKYYIDSDRLAISLDVMNPAALTEHTDDSTVAPNIYISGTAIFKLNINEKAASGAYGVEAKYYYYKDGATSPTEDNFKNASGSKVYTRSRDTANNDIWNHIDIVLKREAKADGTGYDVVLEKLTVNGYEFYVGDGMCDYTPTFKSVDWWSENTASGNFIKLGNTTSTWALDNVLIYEPSDYYVAVNVEMPSYMAPVKNLYVDDDFNNREAESEVNKESVYALGTSAVSGWNSTDKANVYALTKAKDTAADKYIVSQNTYTGIKPKDASNENIKTAEGLVVSFDNKYFDNTASDNINILFAGTTVLNLSASDTNNEFYNIKYYTKENTSGVSQLNIGQRDTVWNKVYFVFTKEYDEATETYYAYLDKVLVDGVDTNVYSGESFVIPEKTPENALTATWWDTVSNTSTKQVTVSLTKENSCIDNLLIYEPVQELKLTEAAASGNVVTAAYDRDVDGTTLPVVTATDINKNVLTAAVTVSGKNVVAAFDNANFNGNAYTVEILSVRDNIYGLYADDYSKVLGTGFEKIDLTNNIATIKNSGDALITGRLLVAAYDRDGKLVGITEGTSAVSAPAALSTDVAFTLPASGTEYKFFVWEGFETLYPKFSQVTVLPE